MSLDKPRILVIDDEEATRRFLGQTLPDWGYEVETAQDGPDGLLRFADSPFDLVLVDLAMPGMDGTAVVRSLRTKNPAVLTIVMTGYGSIESAVEAMKSGASDYLNKPFELDHLEIVLRKVLDSRRRAAKLELLEEQVTRQGSFQGIVGVSREMQRVYAMVRQLAESEATVLVQGETGSGKELVARAIHDLSRRRQGAFMPINCGALPESILESELFGFERGAFTGAVKQKFGLLEQADGGTLFLDEIEATSPALQVKLLRAIQEREVLRVGGSRPTRVDFRLIASSNEDLRQRMEQGTFRADLFYRLNVVRIDMPPLRARRGDIPLLVNHFLTVHAERGGSAVREVTAEAMMLLKAYAWPGNVRELQSAIEQAVLMCHAEAISLGDLPAHIVSMATDDGERALGNGDADGIDDIGRLSLREARDRFERRYLTRVLDRAGGVIAEAARIAGIRRQHFYKKMRKYCIVRP